MLKFILQKIRNKKWMVISLLLGNILMIAVAATNPMYSRAMLQRTMTQDLNDYQAERNRYPGAIMIQGTYSQYGRMKFENIELVRQEIDHMLQEFEVPALAQVQKFNRINLKGTPDVLIDGEKGISVELVTYSDFADHINITHGEMYSDQVSEENVIDVIVNERTFVEQNLFLGETIKVSQIFDEDEQPYRIRVVGIFEHKDAQDPYWRSSPVTGSGSFIMAEEAFAQILANPESKQTFNMEWYLVLDSTKMQANRASEMLQLVEDYGDAFEKLGIVSMTTNFEDVLTAFLPKSQKLNTTITVLQVPIFILLAAFIFMVSRQMLEMEQNEISVFKSRGASKRQIISLYTLQSVLISVFAFVCGVPLGILICNVLGASNAFLEFVRRTALPITIDTKVWIFSGVAAFFSICTMVLPVLKFANVNIVAHKRQKNGGKKRSWWQLVCLDIVLLGVSLYGLYQFKGQEEFLAEQVSDGASLDPMLYLYSSLFMLGAGLLILRLLPWLIRLIFTVGKKWWSPSLYASFLRILRSNNNQGFLVVFLILTVAMGIFNTQTARTINANGEERIRYSIGADVVLMDDWKDNAQEVDNDVTGLLERTYTEPDFGKYWEMEGVQSATKVLIEKATMSVENNEVKNLTVMGINTKEFGETAWFKESLLSNHWYEYLNVISQNANAVLVSSNFRDDYGLKVGDVITYYNSERDSARGVVYGFVDYWPSYAPTSSVKTSTGNVQRDNYLIVAHLSQLQSVWGIQPYQVWIKTKGSSQFLYDYAAESGEKYTMFQDANAEVVAMKNDPVFQGTNGILTIGFIIVLVLCATGFLIYWILSIQSRTLQFGIFRAMGMSTGEVLKMLINEQIFISGASICGGVLVGQLGSKLFVPLIQIAYSSADRVIPLEIISEIGDYLRLGTVIGLMILICMIVLGMLISKIKITQALKLGED